MSPATTETRPSDRVFDIIVERQTGIYDAIRSNNDRAHRFTRSVIEASRQGSRDWAEVSRRFLSNPTDLVGVYETFSEAVADSQARSLALIREWIEDVTEGQRETRDLLRSGLGDAREVVQQAQSSTRELVERVQNNAPQFLRRNSRAGNGKASVAEK